MDIEISKLLYYWWRKMRESSIPNLFENFEEFCKWSVANGYQYGLRLRRIDQNLEYSPDNCTWSELQYSKKINQAERQQYIDRWDRLVQPIRERYKEQLEAMNNPVTEQPKQEPQVMEAFKYEHPDMEREGIVFAATSDT
jgi:glycyl-tRNA synthetase alpha subunit